MTVLVLGATGNTGRPLVEQLLAKNHQVRVIVRSTQKLPAEVLENPNITVTEASVLDLTDEQMAEHVNDCEAVVSCLGHTLDVKGMFGKPRKLCTDAVRRFCNAIEKNQPLKPTKFILMSTVAVKNPDLAEKRGWLERAAFVLFHLVLPPHRDNVAAANHLHDNVGKQNSYVEWCVVRPGTLIDSSISPYGVKDALTMGSMKAGTSTRSNIARFMTELIEDEEIWSTWRFRMPVVTNSESAG